MISLDQIRQRKIFRWAVAYLAGAWLLLQLINLLSDAFGWPALVQRYGIVVLAAGFLAAIVVAWYHGERGAQRVGSVEFGMLLGILVLAGTGAMMVNRSAGGDRNAAAEITPVAAATAEQGSIAVLPFVNMSADKAQEYFSDGLTEELLNVLAKIPELRVAARTSAFAFKGEKVSVDSIGRALRVAHVLEGSVRSAGSKVRITAQLVNTESGYHLWSETYDRELKDVFAVQDEISRAIVDQLQLRLSAGRGERSLVKQETSDPEAHRLVLRGLFAQNERSRESMAKAESLFKQAIERDPNYARAHAGLATVYVYQAYRRWAPSDDTYALAKRTAERALALDATSAEAEAVLGRIADVHAWDFKRAEAHYRRAIELNPGYAVAYSTHAWLLMRLGRPRESIVAALRATEIDRLSAVAQNSLGGMYAYTRAFDKAADAYLTGIGLTKTPEILLANLSLTYADMGRAEDGIRVAQQSLQGEPGDPFGMASLAYAYAKAGRRADAAALSRSLAAQENSSPYLRAAIEAALGNRDAAFKLLDQAVDQHDDFVPDLGVDPVFDSIRDDPRMPALIKRMGLPVAVTS
ncbi:MAG: TPR end-of-group domain-containing protein [Gemmatimonadota bacterium]